MKRIFASALLICTCLVLALGLFSCKGEHEHVYSDFWNYNDEEHWRDCQKNDGAFVDKGPHEWDDGVVKQEADEETVGILSYHCKVCGKEKNERYEFDPNGGFTTTVREDQMKRAFDASAFRNVTMTFHSTDSGVFAKKKVYLFTEKGTYWYELDENGVKISEQYDIQKENGYDVYLKGEDGSWQKESLTKQQFSAKYVDFAARFSKQYTVFTEKYDEYEYNSAEKAYKLGKTVVVGNDIDYATLRFEAKKLTFFEFKRPIGESIDYSTETYGNVQTFSFTNYGTTSFEVPQLPTP